MPRKQSAVLAAQRVTDIPVGPASITPPPETPPPVPKPVRGARGASDVQPSQEISGKGKSAPERFVPIKTSKTIGTVTAKAAQSAGSPAKGGRVSNPAALAKSQKIARKEAEKALLAAEKELKALEKRAAKAEIEHEKSLDAIEKQLEKNQRELTKSRQKFVSSMEKEKDRARNGHAKVIRRFSKERAALNKALDKAKKALSKFDMPGDR